MANASVKLFLSCVSGEFGDYRDVLRRALTRPNVEVKIQEDFKALGGDTLRMPETYIEQCEAVVHFVGAMSGSTPAATSVDDLLGRRPELEKRLAEKGLGRDALKTLTYTQWEAWLAIGFDKDLLIVEPVEGACRGPNFAPSEASRAAQAQHLRRLRAINRYPAQPFASADALVAQIFGSAVIDALVKAAAKPKRRPTNLPLASLGDLFKGRDQTLEALRIALANVKGAAVVGRALHGLGGIGKTRLAIEYAYAYAADYSALLFVRAEEASALNAGLAALAGASVLDLPEQEAREDEAKIEAVLRWLEANPTWLIILDNVDDGEAVAVVTALMPRLKGGHLIVTARAANFPPSLRKLELDALDEDAAINFLLERTADERERAKDDEVLARTLAGELGGLALGLEQAGAQIATDRIGLARYLKLWNERRDDALAWSDPTLTGSEKTLATTWATSVARLSPESRRLLDRLAMLAPDPIPDALLDVAVPGEAPDFDARNARAGLFAYSLATRAKGEGQGFVIHRLVQDFARRAMNEARRAGVLSEALGWVNVAFVSGADDVRTWPVLDPLAPHALAVARAADAAGVVEPTARLFNQLGLMALAKARYTESEPLFRRAIALWEENTREADPNVATALSNLAPVLRRQGRYAEAEQLLRRALIIRETRYGPQDTNVANTLNTLASLLRDCGRADEAEPSIRRALEICELRLGSEHPYVAVCLNNLVGVLADTKRFEEAERAVNRAVAIIEAGYGPNHPSLAAPLSSLAGILVATNRIDVAEPLFRRALAINESSYGPDHCDVAYDLNNLAGFLVHYKRFGEAEPLMRRALAILETSLGPDHPNTASARGSLAEIEAALGARRPDDEPK